MRRMSLVPYRDWAMTPGTRDNTSSSPNPLAERSSGAVTLEMASGVVRMDDGLRVAETVTFGSVAIESRVVVGRCALAADARIVGTNKPPNTESRMRRVR